jgi:hypothetical protein
VAVDAGLDPAIDAVPEAAAVIYAPGRRRQRFPETCVRIHPDDASAMAAADPQAGHHAALVRGPCISSEGFRVYFLVRWLE